MLQKEKNNFKESWNSWKKVLLILEVSIILLAISLLFFHLQPNKKVVINNNIVKKNKKLFANEFNREFIGDSERILIVKNKDIINRKIIFDLNDSKIAKVEVITLNQDISKDLDIKLYVQNKNQEYVITNNNSINSNNLTYKLFATQNERIEIGYKDDPSINSLKTEDILLIKITYGLAE